jgi:hypothetical protein
MTIQTINNGETGATVRGKLNDNFSVLETRTRSLTTTTTSGDITLATVAMQRVTLDAIRQISTPADPGAIAVPLVLILDCAGFTPTWSGVTWLTADGLAPMLNTVSGKRNVITFLWDDTGGGTGAWLGFMAGSQS